MDKLYVVLYDGEGGNGVLDDTTFKNIDEAISHMNNWMKDAIGTNLSDTEIEQLKNFIGVNVSGCKYTINIVATDILSQIKKLASEGAVVDGAHHKQYCLYEILKLLTSPELLAQLDLDKGTPA